MKKALKRSLSFLLAITIIFSSAYVGLAEVDFGSINFTNPFAVKVEAASSGKCGDSAYWSLSSDGVFTVSGSGATWDYNIMGDDCSMGDGEMAFFPSYDMSKINKVIIEPGITRIGNEAFWVCEKLTSVIIPNTVKSIGSCAFNSCRSLKFLNIPDSVTSIADSALSGCEKLVSIDVGVNNKNYCSVAGVLYNKAKTNLMQYPAAKTNVSYIIPDSVTSINSYAFSDCTNLTSISIPNSVTSIGSSAFYKCTSLTSIIIPKGVTSIGGYAFYNCTSLMSIIIPDSVTFIGSCAFYNCTSLAFVSIPNSVTSINYGAFQKCTSLASITIPNSVTHIYSYAFENCKNLTSITIPDSVTCIDGYATFGGCTKLESITIPDSVTSIGDCTFENCINLTSITIPDSVTSIGWDAFEGCTNLNAVYITDIAKWCGIEFGSQEANPLWYAKKLYLNGDLVTSIVIPDGVTSINRYAFENCTSLTSIIIPDSVKNIYESAFAGCTQLENVYYRGMLDDWKGIRIRSGNDYLLNANISHICTCNDWIIDNISSCSETGSKHGVCFVC